MRRLWLVLSFVCLGCELFPSLGYLSDNHGDGGAGGRDGGPDANDGGDLDDAGDAGDADAGDADAGPCLSLHGPAMVLVTATLLDGGTTSTCVDVTEVTQAQYAEFLQAKGADMSGQPAPCDVKNPTFNGPGTAISCTFQADETSELPVTCIDWCDARAYCAWAGKRFCGRGSDGVFDAMQVSTKESDWYRICTSNNPGFNVYPYGATYDPQKCNGLDHGAGAPLTGATLPGCKTGSGVYDLSGNVWEFNGGTSGTTYGLMVGGSYASDAGALRCDGQFFDFLDRGFRDVGFRCCKDP